MFTALPDGDYVVRFFPPAGWQLSPPDVPGAGADEDSDVSRTPSGTDPTLGAYHQTPTITLGDDLNVDLDDDGTFDGEADPTWDVGLWRPIPAVGIDKVTADSAWPADQAGDGVHVVQGRPLTWTYTITNTGNSRLQNVTVTDDGGPGPDFSVTGCTITDDGENADGLSSSATVPFALNRGAVMICTASGTAGSANYANNGAVAGTPVLDDGTPVTVAPPGFPPPGPVTDTDPSSYIAEAYDLALAKVLGSTDLATATVTYTITVQNQGTVPSGAHTVNDVLPDGMSFVSATPAPSSQTGATLTWNLGDLDPDEVATIDVTAHIDDYLARPYRNQAEIGADSAALVQTGGVSTPTTDRDSTPDADPTNDGDYGPVGTPSTIDNTGPDAIDQAGTGTDPQDDADIADIDPGIVYDLALAKVAADPAVDLGEQPEFHVRVYNQGNVPSGPSTVLDQLPTGLSFDAAGSTAGCGAVAGNQVRCTLASLAPGASTLLTLATTIDGTPDDYGTAPWQNWAEIEADSAQTLYGVNDVDSTRRRSRRTASATTRRRRATRTSMCPTAGSDYAGAARVGRGRQRRRGRHVDVGYDLALAKVADATEITQDADATITYTITVANQGNVPSGAYTVTDRVPPGLVPVEPIPGGGTIGGGGGGPATITWSGTNLDPGDQTTFTFDVTVADLTLRPFRNFAEISDDSAAELYGIADVDSRPDADPANDNAGNGVDTGDGYGPAGSPAAGGVDNIDVDDAGQGNDGEDDADIADVNFPLTGAYDLALAKVVGSPTTTPDGTNTYTVTVQNQGIIDSRHVEVTDRIPAGMAVVDLGGATDNGDGTITWSIDNLEPGETVTRVFTTRIVDINQRPFRNQAEITADSAADYEIDGETLTDVDSTPDADPGNDGDYGTVGAAGPIDNVGDAAITQAGVDQDPEDDADIADVTVGVTYDLALVKVGPAHIDPDGTATFDITVANQGNVPSGAYTITDNVPPGMAAEAASDGGQLSGDGSQVVWTDRPSLDPGESGTVTVTARITDLTLRPYTNQAEITADDAASYSTPGGPRRRRRLGAG